MSSGDTYLKYKNYSLEELLQDDYFISTMINPTGESEEFWSNAVHDNIISLHDYELARCFMQSVQTRPEPISQGEIYTLWEDIEIRNKYNLKKRKKYINLLTSAVAGVAVLLALLLIVDEYTNGASSGTGISFSIENVKAPDIHHTDIQLILADNEPVSLEGKEAEIEHNNDRIAINKKDTELRIGNPKTTKVTPFNQLIVPKGKRSMLTLNEGSKIWVNAGSRIVYPATFDKNKREIYVDGEVFLDIAHRKNIPFIVKTAKLNIEVLGTTFNVTAYEKDTVQRIVLVSGTVKVNPGNETSGTVLSPNEMYSYTNGKPQVKIVNTEDYISWKSGIYQYYSENLGIIMERLSRYYGEEIICLPEITGLKCSGKLDLKDDLELVLSGMSQTVPIMYTYDNKRYIITNK